MVVFFLLLFLSENKRVKSLSIESLSYFQRLFMNKCNYRIISLFSLTFGSINYIEICIYIDMENLESN